MHSLSPQEPPCCLDTSSTFFPGSPMHDLSLEGCNELTLQHVCLSKLKTQRENVGLSPPRWRKSPGSTSRV